MLILSAVANLLAAGLLAFTIFFYVVVYTMILKRRTPQNIVIGGAAGALPPIVGCAAASGSVTLDSLWLFAIVFLWTPPHFWALALVKRRDYERAGVPMMPNAKGPARTRLEILVYAALLAPHGARAMAQRRGRAPLRRGGDRARASRFSASRSAFFASPDGAEGNRVAMRLFWFTIFYLFALFALIVVERSLGLDRVGIVRRSPCPNPFCSAKRN